jgi:hypothetical protein
MAPVTSDGKNRRPNLETDQNLVAKLNEILK